MRYAVNDKCRPTCSLNEVNLPGALANDVHGMFESGINRVKIAEFLGAQNVRVSDRAVGRHKANHLEPLVGRPSSGGDGKKKTHLEILNQMIEAGGEQLDIKSTRISPEMTMKAIEMHHKLTEGSVWEDFLGAIGAMGDELAGGPENPDAVESVDEQAQSAPDD